jgi:hypothetical protein
MSHLVDIWESVRRRSKGYTVDAPAYIHPKIMFGHGAALNNPDFIKQHSITHVINCAFDDDSPPSFREAFPHKYKCLNAIDSLDAYILYWYPEFESTMQKFLQDPSCQTVFVHCQCGINRSGFLCVAYACKKLGYPYDEVIRSILKQRPCALTNPKYRLQVYYFCNH